MQQRVDTIDAAEAYDGPQIVGQNVDTLILNVRGILPDDVGERLDQWKQVAQEMGEDVETAWEFAGETLYVKPHGAGRQWRYLLHCPSLHLDVGAGKLNGVICKARLSSAFLWEYGPHAALVVTHSFLASLFGEDITLQVSEAHLCVDVAGYDLGLTDADAFITWAHNKRTHLDAPHSEPDADAGEDEAASAGDEPDGYALPGVEVNQCGRRCTGFEFSRTGPHACRIYDKTKELAVSRKDWMRAVWERNGWNGQGRVWRVEFAYERECLREFGVEDPYVFLDQQVNPIFLYSTQKWLRHTLPTEDANRGRWPVSPFWRVVQQAADFDDATPAVREQKHAGDLSLIAQMLAGCATTAAAYLAGKHALDATHEGFLAWLDGWMQGYFAEKDTSFERVRDDKILRLGVTLLDAVTQAA